MIHKLNNIPLDEKDYKDKLNTIKYLAESNGHDRTIVNKLLHKTQNKQQIKTENNKLITLTSVSYTHLDVYKRQLHTGSQV